MQEDLKTAEEHLAELRKRLILVLIILLSSLVVCFMFAGPVLRLFIKISSVDGMSWNVFSPWDPVRIYAQFAFIMAFVITLPVTLYQIWAYLKPGLSENEQKATLMYIPGAVLLLLAGALFAYFVVFRFAIHFSLIMTHNMNFVETFGVTQYFSFMFNILLPVSIFFELPLVVIFLTRLRILNPERMKKFRGYSYIGILILGAAATPPDVISALIVSLPLIILFEISILLSGVFYRKQLDTDKLWNEKYRGVY